MTAQNHLNLQQGARTPPSFGLAELLWLQTQQMAAAHGQGFFLERVLECSTGWPGTHRVDQAGLPFALIPLTVSFLKGSLKFSSFTESCQQGSLYSTHPKHKSSQMGVFSSLATAFITKP